MREATDSPSDTRPTILYLEEDGDTQGPLKANLRRQGYRVLLALSLEDAADWLGGYYVHADLVLIDLVGRTTDEALGAGRHIRQQARYDDRTPLVVMAEKYGRDVEGTEVNVGGNDWIFYLGEEPNQLKNFLARLLPRPLATGPIMV